MLKYGNPVRPHSYREDSLYTHRLPDPVDKNFQILKLWDEPWGRWFIRKYGQGSVIYLIPHSASASAAKRAIRDTKEPKRLLRGDCFIIGDQPDPKGWFIFVRSTDLTLALKNIPQAIRCECKSFHFASLFRVDKDLLLKMKMGWGPFSDFPSTDYYVREF